MGHASLALVSRQRAGLRSIHRDTERVIRATFAAARQQVTPALQRFTQAYRAEYARVNDDDGEDEHRQQPVSLIWLHTSGQLAVLRGPVMRAAATAAAAGLAASLAAQHRAAVAGQHAASTLIAAAAQDDDDNHHNQPIIVPPVPSQRLGVSAFNGGVPLGSYFNAMPGNAWESVQQAARAQAATGQGSDSALLAALLGAFDSQQTRALVIGQNEATAAYRGMVTLAAVANAVSGWVWVCSFNNSCAACIAMHGSVHDASEPLDSHAGCNCMQLPYRGDTPPDDIQSGEEWFAQQDAATQESILGPAAYNALRIGDLSSISDLLDVSSGSVQQASLKSLGLNASDYLS